MYLHIAAGEFLCQPPSEILLPAGADLLIEIRILPLYELKKIIVILGRYIRHGPSDHPGIVSAQTPQGAVGIMYQTPQYKGDLIQRQNILQRFYMLVKPLPSSDFQAGIQHRSASRLPVHGRHQPQKADQRRGTLHPQKRRAGQKGNKVLRELLSLNDAQNLRRKLPGILGRKHPLFRILRPHKILQLFYILSGGGRSHKKVFDTADQAVLQILYRFRNLLFRLLKRILFGGKPFF